VKARRLAIACIAAVASLASAGEAVNEAQAKAFQADLDACKASPAQTITYRVDKIPGKPVSEAATPEEEARIQALLAASKMPYDKVNHRATYEFVLALVRVKSVIGISVTGSASEAEMRASKACLSKLSAALDAPFQID
jgi:hypothetical protein